jgi:electron transfer flavoprotein alpha subunit
MLKVVKEKCTGCGECVSSCPFGCIKMKGEYPIIDDYCCVGCNVCIKKCPFDAIEVVETIHATKNFHKYKGFWVIIELNENSELRKVSLELLSEARRLADLKSQSVTALLSCNQISSKLKDQIIKTGCNRILKIRSSSSHVYNSELYSELISNAIIKYKPEVVLFPGTIMGRDIAPRISAKLRIGLTADCTDLDIDSDGNLMQIRPTYGGSIMATIIAPNHRPQMATVRPNIMKIVDKEISNDFKIEEAEINISKEVVGRVDFVRKLLKEISFKDISESEVIIAGGYGLGSKENFNWIYKVASKINVAAGASRKAVDEGWAPLEIQIGQTGKVVAPDLYIACGISGALQHTIGIKNAKKVIAINTDPAASIFSMSDIAILSDATVFLKTLYDMVDDAK